MFLPTYWTGAEEDDYTPDTGFRSGEELQQNRVSLLERWHIERRDSWTTRVTSYFQKMRNADNVRCTPRRSRKRPRPDDFDTALPHEDRRSSHPSRLRGAHGTLESSKELWDWWRQFRIGKDFHGFMSLPLSIRLAVYELLLVRGCVFIDIEHETGTPGVYENMLRRYNWTNGCTPGRMRTRLEEYPHVHPVAPREPHFRPICTAFDKKTVALIQGVSRVVQREAESVFWGMGNEFVFPIGKFHHPEGFWGCDSGSSAFQNIKNVNIAFDAHDIGILDFVERRSLIEQLLLEEDHQHALSEVDVREEIHLSLVEEILEIWRERMKIFTQKLSLHSFKLDLKECYCPLRCCRLVIDVFDQATLDFNQLVQSQGSAASPIQRVEVYGVKDEDEKALLSSYFRQRGTSRSSIRFRSGFQESGLT